MLIRSGRFGDFMACSGFPECKNTKPIVKKIPTPCPVCGGELLQKRSKKGTVFYGCSNYPKCDFVSWDYPLEEKCPVCGKYMVRHRTQNGLMFKRCSDPECKSQYRKADNGGEK